MEERRLALHEEFLRIMGDEGHVYFKPPINTRMCFPAIVYYPDGPADQYADNKRYITGTTYSATLIEHDPLSGRVDKIRDMEYARYNRSYKKDNLHHHHFTITR